MSDTHDRLESVEKAIDLFNREGVKAVLHAGDLVSPFVAPLFGRLQSDLYYVWGNNEGDREFIRARFEAVGVVPLGDFATLELGGKRIALLHGTHQDVVDSLAASGLYQVVLRGHTHQAGILEGPTLVVNPGETCGYLSGRQTVALLDLDTVRAEIVDL